MRTNVSFVKSFSNGLDNFATATKSLVSLYKPTVVAYVCGLLIKDWNITSPLEPDINDGFSE